MSISITWGLIARMDGILSAEPLMYCIHTNSHNFTWSPNPLCVMIVIHSLIRCPTVSQFMSQGFTPTHALLDLLLELLSWPCMPNYDILRIAVTTLSLFRFPFSVSVFRFHFPFPPFTVARTIQTVFLPLSTQGPPTTIGSNIKSQISFS